MVARGPSSLATSAVLYVMVTSLVVVPDTWYSGGWRSFSRGDPGGDEFTVTVEGWLGSMTVP